jgi:hypothetical protein
MKNAKIKISECYKEINDYEIKELELIMIV